jgi:phosphocarrier protein
MKQHKLESSESIVICNKLGLHARACSKLVALANKFTCDIRITKDKNNRTVNAKSIMAVMMLAANMGTLVTITTEGENSTEVQAALAQIIGLIANKFGETE